MRREHTHGKDGKRRRHKRSQRLSHKLHKDNNKYKVSGELRALDDFKVLS